MNTCAMKQSSEDHSADVPCILNLDYPATLHVYNKMLVKHVKYSFILM